MEKKYEITAKNFLSHEWIGTKIKIVESFDPKKKNIEGKVINETQNTIWVETKDGKKVIPKKECVFEFNLGNEKIIVEGKNVLKRPEDRVKDFKQKE